MRLSNICNRLIFLVSALVIVLTLTVCEDKSAPVITDEAYLKELLKYREDRETFFREDPFSPFNRNELIPYSPLKYFEPDERFVFQSKLHRYEVKDSIFVLGTKGEYRLAIVEGYLAFKFEKKDYKINVYKSHDRTGGFYHTMWFTDKTTGYETYGVGRYLDFELENDPEYVYTLDFNKAYNPFCAYNSIYTCPIPREEDYIDLAIRAGEKNF